MRRGGILQLLLIGLVAGAIATAVAVLIPWLPPAASREAGRIDFVYWFATIISLFIFAVVMAILFYSIINFRVKKGDLSDGPPVHGHTTIEIIWTIIPTILVTAITIVSAIVLAQDSHAGKDPLKVNVYAQQFAWEFVYQTPGGAKVSSSILHLPLDRGVKLEITSKDVIHSFWVAEFAQKQDAVPGQNNELVITPDRLGTYAVICTELCGLGHSLMRTEAIVETQADFDKWLAKMSAPPTTTTTGGGSTDAVALFTSQGCAACHTFKPIPSAAGQVGPDLGTLKESAADAGEPLVEFIEKSITQPDAYIAPGYQPGVMPSTFGSTLTKDQLDALVQYLADNTN